MTYNYVTQWFNREKWYKLVEVKDWGDTIYGKNMVKISLLTLGQIEGLLYELYMKRKVGDYKMADSIRDGLVDIGYYWFMPDKINTGNLGGHIRNRLAFACGTYQQNIEDRFIDLEFTPEERLFGKGKHSVLLKGHIYTGLIKTINHKGLPISESFYYKFD